MTNDVPHSDEICKDQHDPIVERGGNEYSSHINCALFVIAAVVMTTVMGAIFAW